METIIGLIVGFVSSWVISHYYYRRQTREQINPIPHIEKLDSALREILNIAKIRDDKELESKIKQLVIALTQSRVRVLNMVGSARLFLSITISEHQNGKVLEFLDKDGVRIAKGLIERLSRISTEYEELTALADKQVGKSILNALTKAEHDELLWGIHKAKK